MSYQLSKCPKCNSENINCDESERTDYDEFVETWVCNDCECMWDEKFELALIY